MSSLSSYDFKRFNIFFLDKVLADFVNSKCPTTFKPKIATSVSGHFELLNLTLILFRKEILPWSFFKIISTFKRSLRWTWLQLVPLLFEIMQVFFMLHTIFSKMPFFNILFEQINWSIERAMLSSSNLDFLFL